MIQCWEDRDGIRATPIMSLTRVQDLEFRDWEMI